MKCIAIGNRMMGDDSIGIRVLEQLSPQLEKKGIEIILAETDAEYAFTRLEKDDLVVVLDATYYGIIPGTVTITPISNEISQQKQEVYSQHQPSFLHLCQTYKQMVKGYTIGIEAQEIRFSLELSETLRKKFDEICKKIYREINDIRGENI
jgi:hydrogenase maturation protease